MDYVVHLWYGLIWLVVQMKKGKKYQLRVSDEMLVWLHGVGGEVVRGWLTEKMTGLVVGLKPTSVEVTPLLEEMIQDNNENT